jgi:hypothetical protein
MDKLISTATMWSEICGTVFYKIIWDNSSGKIIAQKDSGFDVHEGDVEVSVCPPYEIFPDNVSCKDLNECRI